MMRILFDGRVCWDHFTGIGRYAFGLLRHLPPAFPEHHFTVSWNPSLPNGRFDWDTVRRLENVTMVPCAGSGLGLLDTLELRSLARAERADILQSPYFPGVVATPVPSMVTIYDVIPYESRDRRWLKSWLTRWGLRRAARHASVVVTLTEVVRAQVVERFGPDEARVVAIPMGVDAPAHGPLHDPSLAAAPYVLSVGVHKPHKNLLGLLDAMALAFPSGDERLVFAGPHSKLTRTLHERAASLGLQGRVVFTGPLEDAHLGPLYRGASALALVSFAEGFGLPLAEAMSVRIPVVASDLPVLHEVCGDAALYADPGSPSSIAAALRGAVGRGSDAKTRLDEGERRAANLSWPALAARYAVCYRKAVARGGASPC